MKGNEKFFRNISNYFQNKGGETNLDNLLEQIQTGKLDDLFKNQPETADEEVHPEKAPRSRRNRESTDFEDTNDDEEYGGTLTFFLIKYLNATLRTPKETYKGGTRTKLLFTTECAFSSKTS